MQQRDLVGKSSIGGKELLQKGEGNAMNIEVKTKLKEKGSFAKTARTNPHIHIVSGSILKVSVRISLIIFLLMITCRQTTKCNSSSLFVF